jgi:RNA-directed DNA polymerase
MIAKTSIERFKNKIRTITKRNRGVKLEKIVSELNLLILGWVRYFKLASCKSKLEDLDSWIRRKVRCYRLKQFKRGRTIYKMLVSRGIAAASARKAAYSGKGWWKKSMIPQIHHAMGNGWIQQEYGLKSLLHVHMSL